MMNKRGYIKTLEAVISIVGILVFTFGVTPREIPNPNEVPFVVDTALKYVTSAISSDDTIRQQVLNGVGDASLKGMLDNNVPVGYTYEYKICTETTCLAENPPPNVSVYSDDVILAGVDVGSIAKAYIIRIWMWQPAPA